MTQWEASKGYLSPRGISATSRENSPGADSAPVCAVLTLRNYSLAGADGSAKRTQEARFLCVVLSDENSQNIQTDIHRSEATIVAHSNICDDYAT